MKKENVNLAIVGHIDHGKSTLIGRLLYDTGFLKNYDIKALRDSQGNLEFANFLDIYKEEREGQMTIDTTKRFFETENCHYTIIDSPGHKEFMKNMLSGVSEAEYALAIVSAKENEGIQEQTKRHLTILNLLGVKLVIVAINKMDTINYDELKYFDLVNKLKKFLFDIGYNPEEIKFIPISASNGENLISKSEKMPWYKGDFIINELDSIIKPLKGILKENLRVGVQNFIENDNLVFGKIYSGSLKLNQEIIFQPSNKKAKVVEINSINKNVSEVFAGEIVTFKIARDEKFKIGRGDVCGSIENPPKPFSEALVEVILPFDSQLKLDEELKFRLATIETKCSISKIIKKINSEDLSFIDNDSNVINGGEISLIKLSFKDKVSLERFIDVKELGRFLIIKGKNVIPGIVLNLSENEKKVKIVCGISPKTLPYLEELSKTSRVSMFRINGAFALPDVNYLKKFNVPLMLDIPGERKKFRNSNLTDKELVDFAIDNKLDFVALSYVKSHKQVQELINHIKSKNSNLKIIAKLETKEVLDDLDKVIMISDQIAIDRGDLGTDIGFEKVPYYQDKIISLCKIYNKKVMIATELAMSTINADRPNYADLTQIYSFVKEGVDFIIMAEETAKNDDPIKPVMLINSLLDFVEKSN